MHDREIGTIKLFEKSTAFLLMCALIIKIVFLKNALKIKWSKAVS